MKNADGGASSRGGRARQLVGMESALGLLLSLANIPADADLSAISEEEVTNVVRAIFQQLDVDGDGLVSWWEWKTVLTAALSGRNPESRFIDPQDTLVIGLQAAHDALSTLNPLKSGSSASTVITAQEYDSRNSPLQQMLPFIQLKMYTRAMPPYARGGPLGEDAQAFLLDELDPAADLALDDAISLNPEHEPGYSTLPDQVQPSKTVMRLQSMVKSLRVTNGVLAKRFERALAEAQRLEDGSSNNNNNNNNGVTAGGEGEGHTAGLKARNQLHYSELERLEQRVQDSGKEALDHFHSLQVVKERSDALATELADLKAAQDFMHQNQDGNSKRSKDQTAKIKEEMAMHAENLKAAKALRARKHAATFTVIAFLKSHFIPKMRAFKRDRSARILQRKLSNLNYNKKYSANKRRQEKAAESIQRVIRGKIVKNELKRRNAKATDVQRIVRGSHGRKRFKRARAEQEAMLAREAALRAAARRNHAAIWVSIAFRKLKHMKDKERDVAARKLQELAVIRRQRKEAQRIVAQARADRDAMLESALRAEQEEALRREEARLRDLEEQERLALEAVRREEAAERDRAALRIQAAAHARYTVDDHDLPRVDNLLLCVQWFFKMYSCSL